MKMAVWAFLALAATGNAMVQLHDRPLSPGFLQTSTDGLLLMGGNGACKVSMSKQDCAAAIATQIATGARKCFSENSQSVDSYKSCVEGFCGKECGKDKVSCQELCTSHANPLFARLAKAQPKAQKAEAKTEESTKAVVQNSTKAVSFLQMNKAPEDELAKEMTHDLEMNFNKIAPFGKEDTAKELQDHAAKTQDTLVDAVENAEVAEIKRAVFRALTRLRAATIKEFDTIARLETQAIDAYNDAHHYRAENPLAHLHEDEAPVETDKLKSFH